MGEGKGQQEDGLRLDLPGTGPVVRLSAEAMLSSAERMRRVDGDRQRSGGGEKRRGHSDCRLSPHRPTPGAKPVG
jgi:hypothetical protein